ncbi:MAG TPA: ATP-dependent DNA ligase [Actinomycetota bacterium]|nr:ATP-dependent DNA ligase [Actinomycetota bacterium]
MDVPLQPPVAPMLARLTRELPSGEFLYEPKWDGLRCMAFRSGQHVDLRSRNQRPLGRYFPELVEALLSIPIDRFVVDGEVVLLTSGGAGFGSLLMRLHPSESRVARLRQETPASFVAFDLLGLEETDVRSRPFEVRRGLLEQLLRTCDAPVFTTPITDDREVATAWLDSFQGSGVDGVVAKHRRLPYQPGKRSMVKVKREKSADCVVAGFRWLVDKPELGSLLLGLRDQQGELRHVGVASSFTRARRTELLEELSPLIVPIEGHPWEKGFGLERSPLGRLAGAAARWSPEEMELDWIPIRPEKVCEVAYDQVDEGRFRYPARFLRWRPDREPHSCTYEQFETSSDDIEEILTLT